MIELLSRAEATGERWAAKRWERALFARWGADAEVQAHLRRLFRREQPRSRLAATGGNGPIINNA